MVRSGGDERTLEGFTLGSLVSTVAIGAISEASLHLILFGDAAMLASFRALAKGSQGAPRMRGPHSHTNLPPS